MISDLWRIVSRKELESIALAPWAQPTAAGPARLARSTNAKDPGTYACLEEQVDKRLVDATVTGGLDRNVTFSASDAICAGPSIKTFATAFSWISLSSFPGVPRFHVNTIALTVSPTTSTSSRWLHTERVTTHLVRGGALRQPPMNTIKGPHEMYL